MSLDDAPAANAGIRIFTGTLQRATERRRTTFKRAAAPSTPPTRPPARVAQMLALAHRLNARIDAGEAHAADLAREYGFTRARICQLLDLTLLAPDIQEEVLFLESDAKRDAINEHALRDVVQAGSWERQRRVWVELNGSGSPESGKPRGPDPQGFPIEAMN